MKCPLCGSVVVFEGLFSLECSAENNPGCANKSKSYKLPETECEWNKIFAEYGNPWGLVFSWGSHYVFSEFMVEVKRAADQQLLCVMSSPKPLPSNMTREELYTNAVRALKYTSAIPATASVP